MKKKFDVYGMTCGACSAHVEKSVSKVEGVEKVSVNLLQNSMQVDYDENVTNAKKIIEAVEKGPSLLHTATPLPNRQPKSRQRAPRGCS